MKYSIFLLLLISSTIRAQFGDPIYVGLYHQFDNRLKQEIHIQDINEDGYLDIVMPGSNFSYYLNNGDNTFILEAINFESPNNLELGTPRMDFADFNNDGEMDILLDRTDYISQMLLFCFLKIMVLICQTFLKELIFSRLATTKTQAVNYLLKCNNLHSTN